MKKYPKALLLILILTLAFLPLQVLAHGGRTDSNGGHVDSDTGEYHYHHGFEAHDHYDMDGDGTLDCPYDFVDRTDHSSNNSGNNSGSGSFQYEDSYDTAKSGSDSYRSQPSAPATTQTRNTNPIANMIESVFGNIFLAVILSPFAFMAYCLPVSILCAIISWLLRLIKPTMKEDKNYKWAMLLANAILCVVLYILFLSPVVDALTKAPGILATVIIIVGILLFTAVCIIIHTASRNSFMKSTIRALEKNLEDLSLQLKTAETKTSTLEKHAVSLESEAQRLRNENREMYATIENLRSNSLAAHGDLGGDDFMLLLASEGICFINGRTPVKGRITDRKPFGDFTAYTSPRGRCFHSNPYCSGYSLEAVHIFKVYNQKPQCSKCLDVLPGGLPEWYTANKDRFSLN